MASTLSSPSLLTSSTGSHLSIIEPISALPRSSPLSSSSSVVPDESTHPSIAPSNSNNVNSQLLLPVVRKQPITDNNVNSQLLLPMIRKQPLTDDNINPILSVPVVRRQPLIDNNVNSQLSVLVVRKQPLIDNNVTSELSIPVVRKQTGTSETLSNNVTSELSIPMVRKQTGTDNNANANSQLTIPVVGNNNVSAELSSETMVEDISPELSSKTIVEDLTTMTDISPAIAMSDSELACYYAVKYVLRSHKQLTEEDVQYASNYISSFYSHSYDIIQENPDTENVLNDEQLLLFLVYADHKGIGKFALTFNEELDSAIKSKDTISLKKILLGPKEMFIELYDNPYLSTEDREFIIRLISREMFAATLALGLLKKKILNLETIDDKCTSETLTFQVDKNNAFVNIAVLTTKCYDEVCIQDAKILEDDQARAIMSQHEKTSESVFTVDKPESSSTPQVYCFNTIDLISAMSEDIPINPKSKEPFSDYALKVIRQRFNKEIAMYRRFKEIKSANQRTN